MSDTRPKFVSGLPDAPSLAPSRDAMTIGELTDLRKYAADYAAALAPMAVARWTGSARIEADPDAMVDHRRMMLLVRLLDGILADRVVALSRVVALLERRA